MAKTLDGAPVCNEEKQRQPLFTVSIEPDGFPLYLFIELRQDLFRYLSMAQDMQKNSVKQPISSRIKCAECGFIAFHDRAHYIPRWLKR
jgi:hypothetical protein